MQKKESESRFCNACVTVSLYNRIRTTGGYPCLKVGAMDGLINGFVPYEIKTSLVKILSYQDKELRGTLYNPYFGREVRFNNVIQMLMLMEELLDSLGYPQKAMESRCFKPVEPAPAAEPADGNTAKPVLATFKLNVLFRQNASWQGRLVWIEEKSETQFRSVLELLMLIDNVLS